MKEAGSGDFNHVAVEEVETLAGGAPQAGSRGKKEAKRMHDILKQIGDLGIVPVVVINDAAAAVSLGEALCTGGLPCAEVTFRTAAAEESIRRMASALPHMLVGAGTVLTVEQVDRAVAAGARFIVSPGFNPAVVKHCLDRGVLVTPGVGTPTEIEMALGFGLAAVKFFPAESLGGLAMLKAISAPYGMLRFIPTGGINAENLGIYLAFPKVLACGGSWMVKPDLIDAGNFTEITRLTREAVQAMLGFGLAHVGLNADGADEALAVARQLSVLFGFPTKEGNSSNFVGTALEIVKGGGRGTYGHLAMQTNNIQRAIAYLTRQGYAVDPASAKETEGVPTAIYLTDEIGGFAVHLLQKK